MLAKLVTCDVYRLTFMSVKPQVQRQGLGSKLLQELCTQADLYGRNIFVLASPQGVLLYKKFHFQVVGVVSTPQGTITSMLRSPH